jgi:serine O-acetyltransferase
MTSTFSKQLFADAAFYQQLLKPDNRLTRLSLLATILCNRGLWLLTFHRIAHFSTMNRNARNPLWWLARVVETVGKYLNAVFCKSEIREDCNFSGRVYVSNKGYVICGAQEIGDGSILHDHLTFGYAVAEGKEGRPMLGKNVWIGPNCILAGPVTVGDGATILPGTYLTYSVPARAVVRGNPARIIRQDFDNSSLRTSLDIVQDIAVEKS